MARLIKRYDNRKLYDTEEKRYVRLAELAALIRAGHEIRVVEAATGEDLTAQTLTKIIVEGEGGRALPPVELLHQVVRWGAQSAESGWAQLQQGISRAVGRALERHPPLSRIREELARLARHLEELEAAVAKFEKEVRHGRSQPAGDRGWGGEGA